MPADSAVAADAERRPAKTGVLAQNARITHMGTRMPVFEAVLTGEHAVAAMIDQVIRPAARRDDLDHVKSSADAIFLDGVDAALENRHLRLQRRIELESGRRRGGLGTGLQDWAAWLGFSNARRCAGKVSTREGSVRMLRSSRQQRAGFSASNAYSSRTSAEPMRAQDLADASSLIRS